VVAADAGPMQIQLWEGAVCSCAETLRQGTAVDTGCSGRGRGTRVFLGEGLRALKEEFCYAARRSGREHGEAYEGFEFEQVVSCRSGDRRWRTKLDFGSRESPSDHRIGDSARDHSNHGCIRRLAQLVVFVSRRAIESKAAGVWRDGSWPENRSCGCARNLWEAGAAGIGARIHRAIRP
jgi:hypothetical protein